MRKLATIETILEAKPHPNADLLDIVLVRGWECAVSKGDFRKGDKCIYFEIDSLLPLISEFEFLSKHGVSKCIKEEGGEAEGYRIKSRKIRGFLSQGLVLSLDVFPQFMDREEGEDVTEELKVCKYEGPNRVVMTSDSIGTLPSFIEKTDEERIQNLAYFFKIYKGKRYVVSEKIDGTSFSCYKFNGKFGVCSRNWELKESSSSIYWKIANKYRLSDILPEGYIIQGEICGEGVQGNPLKLKGTDLYVFHVIKAGSGKYLNIDQMKEFVKDLGMKHVPIVNECFYLENTQVVNKGEEGYPELTIDQVLRMAEGKSYLNPEVEREGLVFRQYHEGEEFKSSFKAISNKYLLKAEK